MTPPAMPAEKLLLRTREHMRVVLSVAYLLYLGLVSVLGIEAVSSTFQQARLWGGVAALVVLLVNFLGLLRNHWLNIVAHACVVPAMWFVLAQVLAHHQPPTMSILWITAIIIALFVMMGSVAGSILVLLLCGGLGGLLLIYPPEPESALLWVTVISVLFTVSVLGFMTMRFIEQNILLHDEATDKLRAAQTDILTGVVGRAALEEEMQRLAEHARKTKTPMSVILADIDHFKQVNDTHGHPVGDDVLRSFAKRLRRNLRSSGGTVGRWGGEEFLILLPGVSRPDALAVAERLRNEVTLSPIAGLDITASFGVASYRVEDEDLGDLFTRADEKLYEAKNAGRNTVR